MKQRLLAIALTGALAAGAALAAETDDLAAQSRRMDSLASQGSTRVESRISGDFASLAGSTENAGSLVTGLRNGTPVTLTSTSTDAKGVVTTTETTFTPPTGKMGYGNVYTSLALAKHQLAALGIAEPTAAQLQAALTGGTITLNGKDVPMTGVLELRAQGMGWGQIAQQYGTKLGPVISGMKSANARAASQPATTTTSAGATSRTSGVTTAAGGAAGQSHGQGNAHGRGITTAGGGASGAASVHGQGHAYGRGIVTGAGSAPGNAGNAAGKGKAN
ncbi:MAG TPA: hypothetical protein VFX67_00855 [Burkholderiales bacterium]|nr:hypothetical protein [Burkholderiales bacterium]